MTPRRTASRGGSATRRDRRFAVFGAALLAASALAAPATGQQVLSGAQMIAKTNASVEGCFRAALRACREVFGACARDGAGVFHVAETVDVALTCRRLDIAPDDLVVLVLSFAALAEDFGPLKDRALEMAVVINETYW